jgi:signal transduction histidine kinase
VATATAAMLSNRTTTTGVVGSRQHSRRSSPLPTGEGTGLGLSISYDIVTQQHGGTITVSE